MASERARAADRGVGERCGVERLDDKSARRDVLIQGTGTAGCSGTGATTAAAGGQSSTDEAAGVTGPMALASGGTGEKSKGGETSGEGETAASMGKQHRAPKRRQKSGKQWKAERKQRTEQQ